MGGGGDVEVVVLVIALEVINDVDADIVGFEVDVVVIGIFVVRVVNRFW